ncbi:MupG family TIM beta-alpha barrel fold protein [uncultured Anaerococcus sp.]|uniref:MupG family TIM beta-alpha barrel fold protein n=1 Tax=uncultured Anaerococcus sp. TaxID=293428 RepID=UPI0025FE4636|nr:MupG family TIM beta-alpha barrel fold protein [uncultured Anaerococcus sp.]
MLGFSIYFEKDIDIEKEIEKNKDFDLVFTSLHYPTSDESYRQFLELYNLCKDYSIRVCVDINNETLNNHPELIDMDLILRLDFGFTYEEISKLSHKKSLAINASTVNNDFLSKLKLANTKMDNIIAIHNFYPLEYSGLSEEYFIKQNSLIKSYGLNLGGFIPGNGNLRGPVYKGLPTLENDRYKNPYSTFIKFERKYKLDLILLSEDVKTLDKEYISKFKNEKIVTLPVLFLEDSKYIEKIKVRADISDYLIRNEREKRDVDPQNPTFIKRGDIVMLNNLSGRYRGEIEIIKKDLGVSPERNVIGRVKDDYLEIVDYIKGGDLVEFDRR